MDRTHARDIQPTTRTFIELAAGFVIGNVFVSALALAWTAPASAPPANNISAPITVGSIAQIKSGSIGVNGLAVFGNSILSGNSYLNFGTTAGTSSYGVRDIGGTLQFKNEGGQWATLASTTANFISSSQWQTGAGGAIYYSAGKVGINTSDPIAPLDVNGTMQLVPQSAMPATCDASRKGAIAITDTTATLCICNGSSWVFDHNGAACTWDTDATLPLEDFGGAFGVVNGAATVNPATGAASCPTSYTMTTVSMDLTLLKTPDYPFSYCYRSHTSSPAPIYDFGGMYGYVNGSLTTNPATGAASCPSGYTTQQVLGTAEYDYDLYLCYRPHSTSAPTSQNLGGIFGTIDIFTPSGNPETGSNTCPTGYTQKQVWGATGIDSPIYYCYQ